MYFGHMSIEIRPDTETFGTKVALEAFFISMYIGNMSNDKEDGLIYEKISPETRKYPLRDNILTAWERDPG